MASGRGGRVGRLAGCRFVAVLGEGNFFSHRLQKPHEETFVASTLTKCCMKCFLVVIPMLCEELKDESRTFRITKYSHAIIKPCQVLILFEKFPKLFIDISFDKEKKNASRISTGRLSSVVY